MPNYDYIVDEHLTMLGHYAPSINLWRLVPVRTGRPGELAYRKTIG